MAKATQKSSRKAQVAKADDDIPSFADGKEFDALSDEEKEKVWAYYDREIPLSETHAPNAAEQARLNSIRKKAGRPKVGQGAKVVAVTIEKALLHRADVFAKEHSMKRAEMIAEGLRRVMGESA